MANSTVCQSKWKPIVEPRRAKPKTYRQAPTHWLKFYEEAVIESEARKKSLGRGRHRVWGPTRQREAKLLTVIGLTTMHAVCHITYMLYPICIYQEQILRNWVLKSLQAYIFLNLYTKSS